MLNMKLNHVYVNNYMQVMILSNQRNYIINNI